MSMLGLSLLVPEHAVTPAISKRTIRAAAGVGERNPFDFMAPFFRKAHPLSCPQ
jgi:hypothetical protein